MCSEVDLTLNWLAATGPTHVTIADLEQPDYSHLPHVTSLTLSLLATDILTLAEFL
jgi:hypothetical protein